ncbi:MAG: hypothetical protein U9Q97_08350, partial [Acidobacteriota bacterium]|nr:hypothetical protein [Acidobacteriota bacterium]
MKNPQAIRREIDVFLLSVKYWLQGDSWNDACRYARFLTNYIIFKKNEGDDANFGSREYIDLGKLRK